MSYLDSCEQRGAAEEAETMAKTSKRNDVHRPGAIVPRDYEPVLHYSLSTTDGGWALPSEGVNCQLDRREVDAKGVVVKNGEHDTDGCCCVEGFLHVAKVAFVATGGTGKCSVCGAAFVYGCVWKHLPTGEHLHLGHECARKY
jgi:hypothetical protein